MIMDPSRRGFSSSINGIQLGNQPFSMLSDHNIVAGPKFENSLFDRSCGEVRYLKPDPASANTASGLSVSPEEDSSEDCDFSDEVLKYINQMLMEEDMEDQTCMLQESLDLQAAEKPFYEVLGKKYPPTPDHNLTFADQSYESPDDNFPGNNSNYISSSSTSSGYLADNCWIQSPSDCNTSQVQASSFSSSNSVVSVIDRLVDSPNSTLQLPDLYNESQSVWQFQKGVEEASKFLPSGNELFFNLEVKASLPQALKGGNNELVVKSEQKDEEDNSPSGSRVRKNPQREDIDLEEERSTKQAAVYTESTLRSEMFDMVLLCNGGKPCSYTPHEALQNETNSNLQQQNEQAKGSNGGKGRGKKQSGKKEVVDLRTLLIQCAQAVAADDRKSANELLKQIRPHSSPFGDGNQRLAHCFADGLEARLVGTGSQIYKGLISKRRSAADILKAYHLHLSVCPFRKMSNFFSNRSIMIRAEKATRLHIIDFGVLYGFQWPTFIQRLSLRPGGPPKLRITGIEFPQPGFRPAERIEETGRRLANYAASFNVPFEYNAIAKKWETIQLEELQIDRDELLVVNCLYRFKNLLDETVAVDSPRNIVLNMIKKIRPDIFIQGIVNGSYNAPFFVTRFREALFHFSAQFDMLETTVLRENWERMLIEKEIFGREALNVIACEGWERVERPETYKQWQVRNLRAGFVQLPLHREIMKRATERVRSRYHKDFVIAEDSQWMLQGWKGRIIYALSAWKPA